MAEYEQMLQKKHALLNRVEGATTESERQQLRRVSSHRHIAATLLPIRSVGVQVICIKSTKYPIFRHVLSAEYIFYLCRGIGELTVTL